MIGGVFAQMCVAPLRGAATSEWTAPTLMATAQRARHVNGDPDCLVSVRFGDGFRESVSHTVPLYRGYAPPHAVLRLDWLAVILQRIDAARH